MQLDLQSPEFITNPYPVYARLREQAPAYLLESGVWLITRYHDVEYLLKSPLLDKDFASVFDQRYGRNMNDEPVYKTHKNFWMLMNSPRRKLVVKALNARKVTEVRALVQKSAEQLVDKWIACGQANLMTVFAGPLPVQVTCNMLNIELEQSGLDFVAETKLMARPLEPNLLNAVELDEANASALRVEEFFREICRQRRKHLGDDLVSQLLIAEEDGECLNEDEIISNLIMLIVAGYGTTANALCNTLRLLFLHPEQRELLLAKPELLSSAVEESLRLCSPSPVTMRTALEAFEFNGVQIAVGDTVYLVLDSANHDPDVFAEPDRFWIERPGLKKSLVFGQGSHYCLGAKLGSIEVEVALETLFRRLPNLTIDNVEQLKWEPTWVLRGLESLPARW